MKKDRNLKAWAQEEENLINDPNNLSQAQWDRRELMFATDPEAYEPKPDDNPTFVTGEDLEDYPF
jgi:hypothetical protein